MPDTPRTCPHCGARLDAAPACQDGPRRDPGRSPERNDQPRERKPWEPPPQPWTLERAMAFQMPFGAHRGKTLATIEAEAPDYITWGAEMFDRNAGRAMRMIVESRASS